MRCLVIFYTDTKAINNYYAQLDPEAVRAINSGKTIVDLNCSSGAAVREVYRRTDEIASRHNLKVLAKLPIDPQFSEACDRGQIEDFNGNWLESLAREIKNRGGSADA
ncbi:MAG: Mrp/NBP35 family ATP-binding protein [Firmicutes bacterium]|nr:Mrp/NBP35 family ATP-binding protein [Bacillota bacterium]